MNKPSFWLRCETKALERRAALSPSNAKKLIDSGFDVFVERDEQRIFDDTEYEAVGCQLVDNNSWQQAPFGVPIIGLKDLPHSDDPLPHNHIHFGHCYKYQEGWSSLLSRFVRGKGTLYDIEFLTNAHGRRVAAFGFYAGFAGAAAGILAYAFQAKDEKLGPLTPYANEAAMINDVKAQLGDENKNVKALVIGALGRCGSGAIDLLKKVGLEDENIIKWDMAETAKGGPFTEIMDVDIFINCVLVNSPVPPFITRESIENAGHGRRLSIVVDVSCDTTNPYNPIPIYDIITALPEPTAVVEINSGLPPLLQVSIDHLPTLLPREASEGFSTDVLPTLLDYPHRSQSVTWTNAEKVFQERLQEAAQVEKLV